MWTVQLIIKTKGLYFKRLDHLLLIIKIVKIILPEYF